MKKLFRRRRRWFIESFVELLAQRKEILSRGFRGRLKKQCCFVQFNSAKLSSLLFYDLKADVIRLLIGVPLHCFCCIERFSCACADLDDVEAKGWAWEGTEEAEAWLGKLTSVRKL